MERPRSRSWGWAVVLGCQRVTVREAVLFCLPDGGGGGGGGALLPPGGGGGGRCCRRRRRPRLLAFLSLVLFGTVFCCAPHHALVSTETQTQPAHSRPCAASASAWRNVSRSANGPAPRGGRMTGMLLFPPARAPLRETAPAERVLGRWAPAWVAMRGW